ncbi:hypothetical protein LJR090_004297 [Bosea sp. LjRoot90]|uniref:hypothetical protein n=1 Tax=Bosea sp. LjRoot90 TaxID=3342342 RepID=UPI003ED08EC0
MRAFDLITAEANIRQNAIIHRHEETRILTYRPPPQHFDQEDLARRKHPGERTAPPLGKLRSRGKTLVARSSNDKVSHVGTGSRVC